MSSEQSWVSLNVLTTLIFELPLSISNLILFERILFTYCDTNLFVQSNVLLHSVAVRPFAVNFRTLKNRVCRKV